MKLLLIKEENLKKNLDFYNNHYNCTIWRINSSKKRYIGDTKNKKCRFCGRDSNQTTFRKDAHVIPEFLGNNSLLSNFECDECNKKFGNAYDNHLSKIFHLPRTILQIKGKNGVPSIKSHTKKSRIDIKNGFMTVNVNKEDEFIKTDTERNRLILTKKIEPFIPINAYKCIVKMALCLIEEKDLIFFRKAISWLSDIENTDKRYLIKNCPIILSTCLESPPFPYISCAILKRKPRKNNVPYVSFFLAFSHFTIQIFLPFSIKDNQLLNKKIKLPCFPNISDTFCYNDVTYRLLNFSSTKVTKGLSLRMFMKFQIEPSV